MRASALGAASAAGAGVADAAAALRGEGHTVHERAFDTILKREVAVKLLPGVPSPGMAARSTPTAPYRMPGGVGHGNRNRHERGFDDDFIIGSIDERRRSRKRCRFRIIGDSGR